MTGQNRETEPLLEMRSISKWFGPVRVLEQVDFDLKSGELHALAGENGAGKSTLMKILGGVHTEYDGEMRLDGSPVQFAGRESAQRAGISMIHQEMSLVDDLSVEDNLFLGREPTRYGLRDRKTQRRLALEALELVSLDVHPARLVRDLRLAQKQMLEIAGAVFKEARILVLDEPTSALSDHEAQVLFERIEDLKNRGVGLIYITHRMEEIYRLADRITVLRDGRRVVTSGVSELPEDDLVGAMIGRTLDGYFPPREGGRRKEALSLAGITVVDPNNTERRLIEDVTFSVSSGEIVGLAGLEGSGNSLLIRSLFGAEQHPVDGAMALAGREIKPGDPKRCLKAGLAYTTNDRKSEGLVLGASVVENITLATLSNHIQSGFVSKNSQLRSARARERDFSIRLETVEQDVSTLSGGNQQKTLLAKSIECRPEVLLLDEPTRGVDVGAKHEIYRLIREWTKDGVAIVLVTSELEELLGLSDRIIVFHRGKVTAELDGAAATQASVMRAAMGTV